MHCYSNKTDDAVTAEKHTQSNFVKEEMYH